MYKLYLFTGFCNETAISSSTKVNEALRLIASPWRYTAEGRRNYKYLSGRYK